MSLEGKRVVITGGGSGIGFAIAKTLVERDASVVIAGRTVDKLKAAKESLGGAAETRTLDVTEEAEVKAFFADVGPFDHLVTAAAGVAVGRVLDLETSYARALMESKYWGQYHSAKYGAPLVLEGGSITLFSGWMSRKPMAGTSSFAAVDGAIEALTRILALELAPTRVNAIVPGLIDISQIEERSRFGPYAAALPAGRVGTPEDVAGAILYLMENGFTTGAVLDVDGGQGSGLTTPSIEGI